MSIKATIVKYCASSEPFVQLLHKLILDLSGRYHVHVGINDYEARKLVRAWARNLDDRDYSGALLTVLVEDIVGLLINDLVDQEQESVFYLMRDDGQRPVRQKIQISEYMKINYCEHLAAKVGFHILQEMFVNKLPEPTPNKFLDTAVIMRNISGRGMYFATLLGLSEYINELSALLAANGAKSA